MDNSPKAISSRLSKLTDEFHKLLRDAPWKQYDATPRPQTATTQKSDSAVGQSLGITQIPPTPPNTDQSKNPWYKTLQGWKSVIEIIAIPFAIGYAIVTYNQWHDLRKNFMVDQRAWVRIQYSFPRTLTLAANSPVDIIQSNVGKSVALHAEARFKAEILNSTESPSLNMSGRVNRVRTILVFPGDRQEHPTLSFKPNGEIRTLTQDEISRVLSGSAYVAVFGIVTYDDQFGPHWTRFCGWSGIGPPELGIRQFPVEPCTLWNAVGDGRPPK